MVAAQAAADAAAARYEATLAGHAQLENQLAQTQQHIAETEAVAKVLTKQVQAIAARAYVTAGEPAVGALFSGDDVLDLGRSTRLLDRANAPNVATIDRLAAAKEDLDRDHARVVAAEKESAQLLASLQSESNRVQQELTAAGNAKAQIEQRIEQVKQQAIQDDARETEERRGRGRDHHDDAPDAVDDRHDETEHADDEAQHTDDEAHDADDEAEPTAAASATVGEPGLPGARSGELRRQLGRAAFGRTNAPGRRHDGRAGTPDVAIVSGTITQQYGSLQGNGVFLRGRRRQLVLVLPPRFVRGWSAPRRAGRSDRLRRHHRQRRRRRAAHALRVPPGRRRRRQSVPDRAPYLLSAPRHVPWRA